MIKEMDLPKEQMMFHGEGNEDVQSNALTVVIDESIKKSLWQRILRWICGDNIVIVGVHLDGEVSEVKHHGNVKLSGAVCVQRVWE